MEFIQSDSKRAYTFMEFMCTRSLYRVIQEAFIHTEFIQGDSKSIYTHTEFIQGGSKRVYV